MSGLNHGALRVLAALRSSGSVTPRSFRAPTIDGGDEMDRLAPRINELRDAGYRIETVMEKTSNGKRYARYFLRGEDVVGASSETPTGADSKTEGGAPTAPQVEEENLFTLPSAFDPFGEAA